MAIIVGDQTAPNNYLTYVLPIVRKDLLTGARLEVEYFKLTKPFSMGVIESVRGAGRAIQGAANGSEATLKD